MTISEKIQIFIAILVFIASIGGWSIWTALIQGKKEDKSDVALNEKIAESVSSISEMLGEISESISDINEISSIDEINNLYHKKQIILERPKLTEHFLFSHLQEMDIYFSLHLEISDKGREKLMREKVVPKIRIWYKILYKMAEDLQYCIDECPYEKTRACGNSYNICKDAFAKGIEEYRNHHLNNTNSINGIRFTDEDIETMSIYSEKFNHYHASSEKMTSEMLHEVFTTITYQDCYTRVWDLLTTYSFAFARVRIDSETAIKNLNGELTGRSFLDTIIGDFEYEKW